MMLRYPQPVLTGLIALAIAASTARADAPALASPMQSRPSAITLANVPGPNGGVEWGRAETTIDAGPAEVLAILHDYSRYAGLFPHFEKSRVLSQRGADAIVYLEAKILHGATTLWGQVRISAHSPSPELHVVDAKMMKGKGNMEQLLARWEVRPLADGEHCQVSFQLLVDPDLPVPDLLVSSELKNSAGRALRALRSRLAQPGAYATRRNATL